MADFETLHLSSPIAEALDRLGWRADDPVIRDASPTVARGHNLLALLPPVPAAATPILAGLMSRKSAGKLCLLLAAESDLEEWAGRLHLLAGGAGLHYHVARRPGRAARRLREAPPIDLLACSLETALALHRRSSLHPESVSSVVLAWPEGWVDRDGLAELMQDLPKETQRIVLGTSREGIAELAERYARRALEVSAPGLTAPADPAGPVRTVSVGWSRRTAVLAEVFDVLDPASAAIWTLDQGHHAAIRQAAASSVPVVEVTTGDVSRAQVIIAFDPPTPPRLRQLLSAGEVVALVPPAAESYVRRIAATRRPLQLPGALDEAASKAEARRAAVVTVLERGGLDRALLTLAPLFERYDGVSLASALFELWTAGSTTPGPAAQAESSATAKIFVGVGKKHGATVNDLVAVLTKEVRIDRSRIGRVELRDGFMLVEIPETDAERVAAALTGTTIRRRRVVARVDAGRGSSVAGRMSQPSKRPKPRT